ncbi:hypothetical protein DFH09DRAFT_1276128 [Mycena vulgaris]|nr:hypothetical protein DFH09DRAFT_1276128 [Mycena vulgaris]
MYGLCFRTRQTSQPRLIQLLRGFSYVRAIPHTYTPSAADAIRSPAPSSPRHPFVQRSCIPSRSGDPKSICAARAIRARPAGDAPSSYQDVWSADGREGGAGYARGNSAYGEDQEQRKTSTETRRADVPIARSLPLAPRRRGLLLLWDAERGQKGHVIVLGIQLASWGPWMAGVVGCVERYSSGMWRRGGGNCRPPPVAPLVANVELGSRDRGPVDARRPELTRRASEELGKWRWRVRDWEALSGGWTNHRESEERSTSACFFPRPPRGAFVDCALVRCDLRPRRACAPNPAPVLNPPARIAWA